MTPASSAVARATRRASAGVSGVVLVGGPGLPASGRPRSLRCVAWSLRTCGAATNGRTTVAIDMDWPPAPTGGGHVQHPLDQIFDDAARKFGTIFA